MNSILIGADIVPEAECFTQSEPHIGYTLSGSVGSPVVVLLHSLGTDRSIWKPVAMLLEQSFRVIAWDARGHGASDRTGVVRPEDWASDLVRLLDELAVTRAALVGVSMGGIQAMAFAGIHAERTWAIVVADSFAALPPEIASTRIDSQIALARSAPMGEVADEYLASTFADPTSSAAAIVGKAIAAMSPDDYIAAVQSCFSADVVEHLDRIATPTLVLWGDRDAKTPRALSEAISAGIRRSMLTVVPDAGHLSNLDNPDTFADEVLLFLDAARPTHY